MTQSKEHNRPLFIGLNKHELPNFVEKPNNDIVLFGDKNDYPQVLIDLYNSSTIHNAIITGKVNYIAGSGIDIDTDMLKTVQQIADARQIKNNANPDETLESVMSKVALDLELFNTIALEVIWKPNGKFDLYHVDNSLVRISPDGETFYYSPDWSKIKKDTPENREKGFKSWSKFDKNNKKGAQLLYYTVHRAGQKHYALPEYVGAVPYIEIDKKIAEYHYNHLENGFMGGTVIALSGQYPGEEAAKETAKAIRNQFQGTRAKEAGGVAIIWQEEGEGETKIESLMPNNFDKQFMQLLDQTRSMIFTGHRVTSPALFGVETNSSFGNRTEIIEKMEVFQSNYVDGRQEILNNIIKELYDVKYMTMARVQPIKEVLSESALLQIATTQELREMAGLPKLDSDVSSNSVADALGTISPLVATKVLETMTAEEIRNIVGLQGGAVSKSSTTIQNAKEDKGLDNLMLLMSKFGRPADNVKVLFSKELEIVDDALIIDEHSFRLDFETTEFDNKVLAILKDNKTLPLADVAEALNTSLDRVTKSVAKLVDDGLLDVKVNNQPNEPDVNRELTPEGEEVAETIELEVVYRYVLRSSADAGTSPIIKGTRDFCRRLITLNRVYTKDEIDQLTAITGRDVWLRRGGFWNRGKNKPISPSCRHIWRQELIEK